MKKFIPYIACGLLLISGWACTRTDDLDVVGVEQGKIVIRTALDPQVETRVVADESAERKITRIDVVVVDPATGNIEYREVHTNDDGLNNFSEDNGNGTLTLKKERNTFESGKKYNIYLIANASNAIATKIENTTATTTLDDLKRLVQEDYISTTANGATTFSTLLHLSGTTTPQATAPQTFLMDAVVTQAKGSEVRDIVLYDGVQTNNTSVYAEFKRAAAKVIINIKQGSSVEFKRTLNLTADDNNDVATMGDAQYEFYNLPTETKVLAEGYDLGRDNNTLIETDLITIPNSGSYPTFVWKDDVGSVAADGTGDVKVQIVGYADAHEWANASTLNYEPSLLLNLPIMWDSDKNSTTGTDGKETGRGGNWYKVPLSQNKVFERNTCYIVNITINAIGAESKSEAIELDDIDYDTRPWDVTTITIGGDSERPKYLKLNTDLVTMYNTNEDNTTLMFASSSEIISVELVEAYYYNKYGERTAVESNVLSTISARPLTDKVNGNIAIFSPIVVTTDAERNILKQQLLEEFGGVEPARPSGSQPTNPVVGEPDPYEYVPNDTSYGAGGTEYRYNSETQTFQYRNWGLSALGGASSWTDMDAPSEYTEALEKYNAWNNLSDEEKAVAINAYNEANKEWEDYNEYQARLAGIEATAKASHKNTIRYMKFKVTNKDGLVEEFNVEQYPVIYVQNSLGWYSYRDDFGGTTFEDYGKNGYVGVSLNSVSNGVWDGKYLYSSDGGSGFWYSKVRTSSSDDTSTSIGAYEWSNSGDDTAYSGSGSSNNARAYIIRVMSTSPDYTIGNPRVIDYTYNDGTGDKTIEITDPAVDNRKLVAPAFMVASRLGTFITNQGKIGSTNDASRLEIFRQHCAQYVEVHGDANNRVIYDDWRLPTEAELKIIMNHQGASGQNADAIDYLLNAVYYFAAHGPVFNTKNDDGVNTEPSDPADEDSKSVRCVRDAYNDPKEN